jgi:hypothetical protein
LFVVGSSGGCCGVKEFGILGRSGWNGRFGKDRKGWIITIIICTEETVAVVVVVVVSTTDALGR